MVPHSEVMISTLPTTLMLEQLPTPTLATPTNHPTVTFMPQFKPKFCWQEVTTSLHLMLKFIILSMMNSFLEEIYSGSNEIVACVT